MLTPPVALRVTPECLSKLVLAANEVRDVINCFRPEPRASFRVDEAHRIGVILEPAQQPIGVVLMEHDPMHNGHVLEQRASEHGRLKRPVG